MSTGIDLPTSERIVSKGSSRRPAAVPRATVDANYERTFRAALDAEGRYLAARKADQLRTDLDRFARTTSGRSDAVRTFRAGAFPPVTFGNEDDPETRHLTLSPDFRTPSDRDDAEG